MPSHSDPIRALLVQPTLAKYRLPVYRELAGREGIDSLLWYGDHNPGMNVEPDGFAAELKPIKSWRLAGQEALWHQAQIDATERKDVDALVLSWGSRYLSLGPALRRAKRRGLPVVLWGHGYSRTENALSRWARNRIAKLATVLMFYDEQTAAAAIESGWPADRVFTAPNAIDQAPIAAARDACLADSAALNAFRESEELIGRRIVLYVSRFIPENRVELLIEAIDHLRKTKPEVLAVLVGGGQEFSRIDSMVAQRGLADHVRLLGPIYEEERLASWFVSADLFVYPAAIGLSLLHAFGYGLPVVTDDSSTGHNPEIIAFDPHDGPNQNGACYRTGDAASFANTILRLMDDETLRNTLSANALATIEQRYNVPAMVDGMEAALRRCVELSRSLD